MGQVAVLLWLGLAGSQNSASPYLQSWQHEHQLLLEAPRANAASRPTSYDKELVNSLERQLEQARVAAASLEESNALAWLDAVKTALHAHPELPQAAWLLAEAHSLHAQIESARGDPTGLALELLRRRVALEGPRAERFMERTPGPPDGPLTQPAHAIRLLGLAPVDEIEWDGRPEPHELVTMPGEHQVRVLRAGRLLTASWITVGTHETQVPLSVPPITPCSEDDFFGVFFAANGNAANADADSRLLGTGQVRCSSWVAARPVAGGISIALCRQANCQKPIFWSRTRWLSTSSAMRSVEKRALGRFPSWPHYVLAGSVVAAVTGIVLWQTGVFDSEPAPQSEWVFTGVQPLRLGF